MLVVRGDPRAYLKRVPGPRDVALVVELADASLRCDRKKARIYAEAGYAAYWIVDVENRVLEVYGALTDGTYASVTTLRDNDEATVPVVGGAIRVAELLP